jgi:urea transport system substrate-binding protein
MRRWLIALVGVGIAGLAVAGYLLAESLSVKPPIVVGLLHSKTGSLAASERAMLDAEVLALEEINAEGGILGRPVRWVIGDGRSDDSVFAQQAQRLIHDEKVSVLFGCAASHCRKAVKHVVETNDHLLFYPASYEGAEKSPNIVYVGGPANQVAAPALSWCARTLNARKFFLVGTDAIGSHVLNALLRDEIHAVGGQVVGEEYVLLESHDVAAVVDAVKKAGPEVLLVNLEGDSIAPFYGALARAGIGANKTRVVSFGLTEEELSALPRNDLAGQYVACKYVQAIERSENTAFVKRFKARYGADRVTSDGAVSAYTTVKIWAAAVVEADTDEPLAVRDAVAGLSANAPETVATIDPESMHNWRPFFLGKVRDDGQLDIVFSLPKGVNPVPYPATRPKAEWEALVSRLSSGWGGQWANPARSVSTGR